MKSDIIIFKEDIIRDIAMDEHLETNIRKDNMKN